MINQGSGEDILNDVEGEGDTQNRRVLGGNFVNVGLVDHEVEDEALTS